MQSLQQQSVMLSWRLASSRPSLPSSDPIAKITKVFQAACLDGHKMATCNARGVEVAVRNVTQGEAWVADVQMALQKMLSSEAATEHQAPNTKRMAIR